MIFYSEKERQKIELDSFMVYMCFLVLIHFVSGIFFLAQSYQVRVDHGCDRARRESIRCQRCQGSFSNSNVVAYFCFSILYPYLILR